MSYFSSFDFLGIYNKSYKSAQISQKTFKEFLSNLKQFYEEANPSRDSEENLKNKFAQKILGSYQYETDKNRIDLVIFKNAQPQVIFEFKNPKNKNEMLQCDDRNISKKALHETIWYFFNQTALEVSYGIKHAVITDTEQFYFFDPKKFTDRHLEKVCLDFKDGKLAIDTTQSLYPLIEKIIASNNLDFDYCYIDLRKIKNRIKTQKLSKKDIDTLKILFKLLHPDFLLREFNPRDSNELNEDFYRELLFIFGLEEVKNKETKGKVLIKLSNVPETISYQIKNNLDCDNDEDVIKLLTVWLNRILFLKLFESQLVSFNRGDKNFAFLTSSKIKNFSSLNNLFFNVLGKSFKDRSSSKDWQIPYLNSSLFELHPLERQYARISNLQNDEIVDIYDHSILKQRPKKDRNILEYLFDFLDSYSFTSTDESEHKELINSSVLGLIFEKLNGYKDGSFFTPGYITEYMAKTAIDKAIIEKFNAIFSDKARSETIEEVSVLLNYDKHKKDRRELYNSVIDSIRICDPACGSGHFLVSALNYLIYLKSYFGLLPISNSIEIHNDSLVIFDHNSQDQFSYIRDDKESTKIQKTLFNEKANIIKNCLFGVDINPNSVEICRLRLWIELLKNAYYKDARSAKGEMALLPNIDINIKCGNSLMSAYTPALGESAFNDELFLSKDIEDYRLAVVTYKNEENKNNKKIVIQKIEDIKNELYGDLFSSVKSKNTLEWMIEFPEVLDENGHFCGFDVILCNPPYVFARDSAKKGMSKETKEYYYEHYSLAQYQINLYHLFLELGTKLLKNNGVFSYIVPNNWLTISSNDALRRFVLTNNQDIEIINFYKKVFSAANVETSILTLTTGNEGVDSTVKLHQVKEVGKIDYVATTEASRFLSKESSVINIDAFKNMEFIDLVDKLENKSVQLKTIATVKTGLKAYEKGKGTPEQTEEMIDSRIYHSRSKREGSFPYLSGEDVQRYHIGWRDNEYLQYGKNLAAPRTFEIFSTPRILVRQIPSKPPYCISACYTKRVLLNDINSMNIFNINKDPYFVLGILNSRVTSFWFAHKFGKLQRGLFPQFKKIELEQFPIPSATEEQISVLAKMVKEKLKSPTQVSDDQIDQFVYQVFDITSSEIELIENFDSWSN